MLLCIVLIGEGVIKKDYVTKFVKGGIESIVKVACNPLEKIIEVDR